MVPLAADYECILCGKQIKPGDFFAVLGEAPPSGLLAPTGIGRVDKTVGVIGATYNKECIPKLNEENRLDTLL